MFTFEICMEIKVLHKRGMSIRAIARELGIVVSPFSLQITGTAVPVIYRGCCRTARLTRERLKAGS